MTKIFKRNRPKRKKKANKTQKPGIQKKMAAILEFFVAKTQPNGSWNKTNNNH